MTYRYLKTEADFPLGISPTGLRNWLAADPDPLFPDDLEGVATAERHDSSGQPLPPPALDVFIEFGVEPNAAGKAAIDARIAAYDGAGPGAVPFTGTQLGELTVADLPPPTPAAASCIAYVTDEVAGPRVVYCDGTNWRRISDDVVVSS